ncbi:MAG: DPP IV N-terminal domain-containing protein [Fimbriimonas sp.]
MRHAAFVTLLLGGLVAHVGAQDRLATMPRFDRYEKLRREIPGSVVRGDLSVRWAEDSKSFTFNRDGKTVRFTLATGRESADEATTTPAPANPRGGRGPERGRQFDRATSRDGKRLAFHRDRNVYLSDPDGKNELPVTTDGSVQKRTKYGVASWVYGEELEVREALWWSPDSARLAYYFFDESGVKDYFLGLEQTKFQNTLDTEAYPKAGTTNPKVGLLIYDVASAQSISVKTDFASDGGPGVGHYVYAVRWSPDGRELLFNRTNRKQNVMELCAADPTTGNCRVVLRESQPQSWADNSPTQVFLADQQQFLILSERNGFRNIYLHNLAGTVVKPITQHNFDVDSIVRVDEKQGYVFYMARSGANPYLAQLHRARLDGTGDIRLTDPATSHRIQLSPDGKAFLDTAERLDLPPTTTLRDARGKEIKVLAKSDLTKFDALKLKRTERIEFLAADGKTKLYGWLQFPSDFDETKKYPLVVSVYGGPESGGSIERFQTPDSITEMGFLVAWFDGRGTNGRGKAFKDAVYGKLGVVEIDDQAAGAASLAKRPYVDGKRIGIHGTSYGGYASLMALLRHPEVFAAACSSSPVTDWRHYDTIYTERYMGLPDEAENKSGYDAGSANTYAKDLKGRLLIYFGTADNNVHPSNTLMFCQALNRAGKGYEMFVGPDAGHSAIDFRRTWEFFVDQLITKAP